MEANGFLSNSQNSAMTEFGCGMVKKWIPNPNRAVDKKEPAQSQFQQMQNTQVAQFSWIRPKCPDASGSANK